MALPLDASGEAYVIADYLMSAAIRLRITDGGIFEATRRALERYGESADVTSALAFLDAIERSTQEQAA